MLTNRSRKLLSSCSVSRPTTSEGIWCCSIRHFPDNHRAIQLGRSAPYSGGDDPLVIAFGGKARVFAISTDDKVRDEKLSIKFTEKAVGLERALKTTAYKVLIRDTLAAAYAEAGRFGDAIKEQKNTIAMLKDNRWTSIILGNEIFLDILSRHLRQFEQQQPLRGGIF